MKAIEDSHFNTSDIVHVLDVFFFSCHRTQCVFCSLSEKTSREKFINGKNFFYHIQFVSFGN